MPRSLQEIDADIAQVKAEIALRDKYERGFNQPQTKVGWGSYIVNNDRGLLDQYQNRENQWKNLIKQQEFQAAERALQQKFQEEQNRLNRNSNERIAGINKLNAADEKRSEAELQYQKFVLAREKAKAQGLDTSELDLQINHLVNKYGFDKAEPVSYDPRNNPDYQLAKFGEIGIDNTVDEIDEAIKAISQYQTPAAAKRLAELDKVRIKRQKYDDAKAHEKELVAAWNGGELSDGLVNLGYTTQQAGNYVRLMNKNGERIRSIKINKGTTNSEDDWNL